jgi:hypothetical protein
MGPGGKLPGIEVAPMHIQRQLTEFTFDGHPVNREAPDARRFGPIPYVPGSHVVKVTVVCKQTGSRRMLRTDYNLRLTLGELRGTDTATLVVVLDFDGGLHEVNLKPAGAGSISRA